MDLWCPFARYAPVPGHDQGSGAFTGGGRKICHHSTEGSSYAGAFAAYKASGSLPHFTDTFERGIYRVWQHLPLDVAASALKHPKGSGETNHDNVLQIEHVGRAAQAASWDDGYLLGIAVLCRWLESVFSVPRVAPYRFVDPPRLDWDTWHAAAGHVGHCHVPFNDHHDPGPFDIGRILTAGLPATDPIAAPSQPTGIGGTLEGVPVHIDIVSITTDALGDGSVPAPPGFLTVMPAGSHDKYDDAIPADVRDKDSIVVPIGARPSRGGMRLVVAGGPRSTTVGAPVLVRD